MTGTLTLLNLAGYVALLLWGVHMASTGVMRAFGSDLRRVLGRSLRYRVNAFLIGLGVTAALQSSTATGLMATSFVASGVIGLVPALAVMLGANVGTTLIVQVLSLKISLVAPVLVLLGVIAFKCGSRTRIRDLGRVWIGLGLILLALHLLVVAIEPAVQVPAVRAIFGTVASAPMLGVLIAAALAWAVHSSVAIVLLVISLAGAGVIEPAAVVALVIGANLGSAVNPVPEGASGGRPANRRLPIGILLNRAIGVAVVLPLLGPTVDLMLQLDSDPIRLAANFAPRSIWPWRRRSSSPCRRWRDSWSGSCPNARSLVRIVARRSISTTAPCPTRISPWPTPPARPCAWPTSSRPCCAA
ncbi:Na/Pi cotransporter family protein [Inquilinus limosus]|uniref:Na/Pi cotransporter family protein n=1 Tax=Inquilinus limosus TaxID=171674 RepID=UPI003F5CBEFE